MNVNILAKCQAVVRGMFYLLKVLYARVSCHHNRCDNKKTQDYCVTTNHIAEAGEVRELVFFLQKRFTGTLLTLCEVSTFAALLSRFAFP